MFPCLHCTRENHWITPSKCMANLIKDTKRCDDKDELLAQHQCERESAQSQQKMRVVKTQPARLKMMMFMKCCLVESKSNSHDSPYSHTHTHDKVLELECGKLNSLQNNTTTAETRAWHVELLLI